MPGPPKTKEFQKREKENLQSVQLQVSIPQRISVSYLCPAFKQICCKKTDTQRTYHKFFEVQNCLRAQLRTVPRLMLNYSGKWNIKIYVEDKELSVMSSAMLRYTVTDVLKDYYCHRFQGQVESVLC
jgi:hypothetical protein